MILELIAKIGYSVASSPAGRFFPGVDPFSPGFYSSR
jgi:hypothetical protein